MRSTTTTHQPGPNELRDHLANERTFLSWIRTAITIVGLGFVVAKSGTLIHAVGHGRIHELTAQGGAIVGVILVVGGIVTVALATVRFERIRRDIENSVVRFSPTLDIGLALIVGLLSVMLVIYIAITT